MAVVKLVRAERYFKSAYALAPSDYDTFQIDNHYARFLLEKALVMPELEDAKILVDKASAIVLKQMISEVRFYPYRVAIGIFRFFDRVKSQLSPANKAAFRRTFLEIEKRANAASGSLKHNKYVLEALLKARAALAELGGS